MDKRKIFPEKDAIIIITQVLQGLLLIHSKSIIHRDIKPANILIQSGKYKLTDLGFAKQISEN
jgi:serine/threonine-protein kinase ULK/ATG1